MFPLDVSVNGHVVDDLFIYATYFLVGTFAIIIAILVYCLIRFRKRPGHRAVYSQGDTKLSTILTILFAGLVFVVLDINLAVFDHHAFKDLAGTPPDESEALVIDVHAQQYQWNFRYAGADGLFGESQDSLVDKQDNIFGLDRDEDEAAKDDLESISEVAIPVNTPVIFKLTSNDVLHSFFPVNFRNKMDVLPGMTTSLYIEATQTGDYEIACAQLCGLNHYKMRAVLKVLSQEDYDAWIEQLTEDTAAESDDY